MGKHQARKGRTQHTERARMVEIALAVKAGERRRQEAEQSQGESHLGQRDAVVEWDGGSRQSARERSGKGKAARKGGQSISTSAAACRGFYIYPYLLEE